MRDSQTKENILKSHVIWAGEQDFCDQCIRPWQRGRCSCNNIDHGRVVLARKIGR